MTTARVGDSSSGDWIEVSDPACLPATPRVSVLMLAYNHGAYLGDAIESVLAQKTRFPIELLIGEDCSQDDTRELALHYQHEHPASIRVILSTGNAGMHRNHRRLVDLSKGRYLAYCEGDDYWNARDKLEQQVAFLDDNPAYGAVHSEFSHIALMGGRWRSLPRFQAHHRGSIPEGNVLHDLLAGNFIQTCTLMARTDEVRAYFASALPVSSYKVADWPLCLFIASRSKIGYIDRALATYRRTPGSVTNSGFRADIARAEDSMRMVSDFCRLLGIPAEVELMSHANAMRHIVDLSLRAGDINRYRSAVQWQLDNSTYRPNFIQSSKHRMLLSSDLLRRLYCQAAKISIALRVRRTHRAEPFRPAHGDAST